MSDGRRHIVASNGSREYLVMQIYDDKNDFSDEQKKLVLNTTVKRLRAKGLADRISALKLFRINPLVSHPSPSCKFEDEQKTIVILYIQSKYFCKPNIKFVIYHEIQHRIDELNDRFGYDPSKKEKLRQQYGSKFIIVLTDLWNIYINGRLEKEGLYQIDPSEKIDRRGVTVSLDDKSKIRLMKIDELKDCGVHNAKQVYDMVWNAKEGELSYDQLAQLALDNMTC